MKLYWPPELVRELVRSSQAICLDHYSNPKKLKDEKMNADDIHTLLVLGFLDGISKHFSNLPPNPPEPK